ncbi:MAG: thiamine pyrophosphate-dependent enzyme, partial [Bacteroidota bacterium]
GHVGPENDDHLQYRSPEELHTWKEQCPISHLQRSLLESGTLSEIQIEHLESEISREIEDAFAFAKSSPFPVPDALTRDVFADRPWTDAIPLKVVEELPFDFRQSETVPRPY